jgi:DNA-3-methyladenine glycosylase II
MVKADEAPVRISELAQVSGTLHPTPPFDFNKTLAFIEGFSPTKAEQSLAGRALSKAIMVQGQAVVFTARSTGSVEAPRLEYTLFSAQPLPAQVEATAVDRLRFFLSLDDDLRPFYAAAQADPAFAPEVRRLYGLHHVKFPTPFENAAWAVLSQRAPIPVARKLKDAVVERFGANLVVDCKRYWAFPEAATLAAVPAGELAALLRNDRKAQYLAAAAAAFAGVDEAWLRGGDYDAVLEWLLAIKGIGEWSADFILLRGLGRMQALHFTPDTIFEQRMSRAISRVYAPGRSLSAAELRPLAERYGQWQVYWSLYLRTGENSGWQPMAA